MADDNVTVNLTFTATDNTSRITDDMVRKAQEGTRAIEAAYQTRLRAIETMAKRAGISQEEMHKRVEKASKDSTRSQEEAGKRTVEALKKAAEGQERFTRTTEKSAVTMRQAGDAARVTQAGYNAMARAALDNARASEKMIEGLTKFNRAAGGGGGGGPVADVTKQVESSTLAFGKFTAGLYLAEKAIRMVFGEVKQGYQTFAANERAMNLSSEALRLNVKEQKELETSVERMAGKYGMSYADMNKKALDFAATTGLTGDKQIKALEMIGDAALASGGKWEDAETMATFALNKLGTKVEDLPKIISKWMTSIPPAAQGAFADMLNRVMPSLNQLDNKGKDIPEAMIARFRVLTREMGGPARRSPRVWKTAWTRPRRGVGKSTTR